MYQFDYIEPSGFPERLSFSQDHWGFFNGENNTTLVPKPEGYIEFEQFTSAANRDPVFAYACKGLLNKITYPTGGYNQMVYEPNTYYGEQITYPDPELLEFDVETGESPFYDYDIQNITNIPCNQKLYIKHANVGIVNGCDTSGYPTDKIKAFFSIVDDEDEIVKISRNVFPPVFENEMEILPGMSGDVFYADILAGENYELKLRVNFYCLEASVDVNFYDEEPQSTMTNLEAGGCRVKKIISFDPIVNNSDTTRYYYGPITEKDTSSGDPGKHPIYLSAYEEVKECEPCDLSTIHRFLVSSSSLMPMFNSSGSNVCYEYITVSKGNDEFKGGAEEHRFLISRDIIGNSLWGNNILNAPLTNTGWNNGKEKKVIYYKKADDGTMIPVSSTEHFYSTDERNADTAYGYSIKKNFDPACVWEPTCICQQEDLTSYRAYYSCIADHNHVWSSVTGRCIAFGKDHHYDTVYHPCYNGQVGDTLTFPRAIECLDVLSYQNISYWHYLYKTVNKQFDEAGQNPLISTTRYYYDNEKHLQLTRTSTSTSTGDSLVQIAYFPDDVTAANALPGGDLTSAEYDAICHLKRDSLFRIAEPIQIENYKNLEKLNIRRTKYKDWEGLFLPEVVQQSFDGNPLEDRIEYHQYDTTGNPVEVSKADGVHITYLWGYQYSKVIAEIQNASYQQVLDDLDVTYAELQGKTDAELRGIFSDLRDEMDNAMILSYTHHPQLGLTSQTDVNNKTTYYDYDPYGRLETVKDNDSKIVKHMEYKYLEP